MAEFEEVVKPTHAPTVLGIISAPPDLADAASITTYMVDFPNELEYAGNAETGILVYASNLELPWNGNQYSEEFFHIVGLRYGKTDIKHGYLTLDGRAPADYDGTPSLNNDSGMWTLIYSLSKDTYLLYREAGSIDYFWRFTTVAWIIRIDENGTPIVIDSLTVASPCGFNPFRGEYGELIFLNPTISQVEEEFATDWGGTIPTGLDNPDILGCFGYTVSPTGFGARTRYPDPVIDGNIMKEDHDISDIPDPGVGLNSETIMIGYYKDQVAGGRLYSHGLYTIATGLTSEVDVVNEDNFIFTNGHRGNIHMGQNKFIGWWWGDNTIGVLNGTTLTSVGAKWDANSFHTNSFVSGVPVLDADGAAWTDRTAFGTEEVRYANYERSILVKPDPPYTSIGDVYDRTPQYQSIWTREEFIAAVNAELSTQAEVDEWLAVMNAGRGEQSGYYIGFQGGDLTTESIHWAIWDWESQKDGGPWSISTSYQYPVWRILGISGTGKNRTYFTMSDRTDDSATGKVMIVRWDPIPPEDPDPVTVIPFKRPVRMYPRKDSRGFQGLR